MRLELLESNWALPLAWATEGLLARALLNERPAGAEPLDAWAARSSGSRRAKIAVLPVEGLLTEHDAWYGTTYQAIRAHVRSLTQDPDVSTIVLAIHSPGGGVYGVHETADVIRAARKAKRVVAVANAQAGSGAYWLASQAREIVVTPSGEVGSIGVFQVHVDATRFNERIGLAFDYVVSSHAPYKVELSPDLRLSDEARAEMQRATDSYEQDFIRAVADGRGVSQATVRERFGQGRLRRAEDAVAAGMADRVATLDDVLDGAVLEDVRGQQAMARQADQRLAIARYALE